MQLAHYLLLGLSLGVLAGCGKKPEMVSPWPADPAAQEKAEADPETVPVGPPLRRTYPDPSTLRE